MNPTFPINATDEERAIDWQKIAEISDQDFGFTDIAERANFTGYSVRVLLYNESQQICVIKSEKYGYLQLPGGGIETGENIIEALIRETREESGFLMKDIEPLGYVAEHRKSIRNDHSWNQNIAYVFKAKVGEEVGTDYMDDEIAESFKPVWMDLSSAIEFFRASEGHIENYSGNFSNRRDLRICEFMEK